MTTTKYEVGYDDQGSLYKYELDSDGIVIRKNKKLVTKVGDSRTKSKQGYWHGRYRTLKPTINYTFLVWLKGIKLRIGWYLSGEEKHQSIDYPNDFGMDNQQCNLNLFKNCNTIV